MQEPEPRRSLTRSGPEHRRSRYAASLTRIVSAVLAALRCLRLAVLLLVAPAFFGASATFASVATRATRPRVVLVTFNCDAVSFVCPAFEKALRETGVSGRLISPDPREDPAGTLSLLAAQGYDPVIVDGAHAQGLAAVAARFPKTHFVVVDAPLTAFRVHPANLQALVAQPSGAAYLAGWLAARLEMRRRGPDVVGAVGGLPIPEVNDFITGFTAGAKHADPGITVLTNYSRDFVDPNKCEALAKTQIAHGAGVVFNVAGACGLGTLAAAKQAGVWGIGVDSDQSILGPFILTSVIKHYDVGFVRLLRQAQTGKLSSEARTTVLGIRNGGASLGPISPKVPASLLAGLDRVRQQILDGRLRVPLSSGN
jgi:basic membrane protein A